MTAGVMGEPAVGITGIGVHAPAIDRPLRSSAPSGAVSEAMQAAAIIMAEAARRLLAETGVPPEGIRRFPGQGDPNTQLTDADPDAVTFDLPVELTFRRFHAGGGLVNYFWKFRPLLGG